MMTSNDDSESDARQESIMSGFLQACTVGDAEAVVDAIALGADIESSDNDRCTALVSAITSGSVRCVEVLLEAGATLEKVAPTRVSALMIACGINSPPPDLAIIRLLLHAGAEVNAKDTRKWSPIMWAARSRDAAIVSELLSHGADAQARDKFGNTPFHHWTGVARQQVKRNRSEVGVAKCLIQAGVDCYATNDDGLSPFMGDYRYFERLALLKDHLRSVNLLDLSVVELLRSVQAGAEDQVTALVNDATGLNRHDSIDGYTEATPLHVAAACGNHRAVEQLLMANADPNAIAAHVVEPGLWFCTSLAIAATKGDAPLCRMLVAAGAAIDHSGPCLDFRVYQKRIGHLTPLMLAAERGNLEAVLFFIEAGADVNAVDVSNPKRFSPHECPLGMAELHGHEKVAELLREAGATSGRKT